MDKFFITVEDACKALSIGRSKFYVLISRGEIPFRKCGKKTLIATADLKNWAERQPVIYGPGAV